MNIVRQPRCARHKVAPSLPLNLYALLSPPISQQVGTKSLKAYSQGRTKTISTKSISYPASSSTDLSQAQFTRPYASTIPDIDICGNGSDNVTCPGAGINGYYYRCCSSAGHCGMDFRPSALRSADLSIHRSEEQRESSFIDLILSISVLSQ